MLFNIWYNQTNEKRRYFKMTKVEKYLYKRIDALSEEKVVLITKINKIAIEIEEVEVAIEEMSREMDVAYEIFSPKPKKNDFNKKEIDRLIGRKSELETLRDEFVKQCMVVEEDIVEIKESLGEEYDEDLVYDAKERKEELVYGFKILDEQEKEKQEIATRINQSTVSSLSSLIYKCDICSKIIDMDPTRAKLELEIISNALKEMSENVKDIIYQLKPVDYKDIKLEVALERIVNLAKINSEMLINLNVTGNKLELSPIIEMAVVRIIQEAVDNSIKYSEGKNLNINFVYGDEFIKLEIVDDGKGIDFEKAINDNGEISSLGLSMMRERTYLLGGDINISSDVKGTKIDILIPLNS